MFTLSDLKQSKVYQEAKEEGRLETKLEIVPLLLELGMTVEQIAERLSLKLEMVEKAAQKQ